MARGASNVCTSPLYILNYYIFVQDLDALEAVLDQLDNDMANAKAHEKKARKAVKSKKKDNDDDDWDMEVKPKKSGNGTSSTNIYI
jgi:hypothetical protein